MQLTYEEADSLLKIATEDGIPTVTDKYSEHSGYGKPCLAIFAAPDGPPPAHLKQVITQVLERDRAAELLQYACTTPLGRGYVMYFPGIKLEWEQYSVTVCRSTQIHDDVKVTALKGAPEDEVRSQAMDKVTEIPFVGGEVSRRVVRCTRLEDATYD